MNFDFDTVINRYGTECIKYDGAIKRGKPQDILPLWVADMDFPAPPAVLKKLEERVQHGIFGYSEPDEDYFAALRKWFTGRFDYQFEDDWVTLTPGVVHALATAIRAITKENDGILIQEPVYYPFRELVVQNRRKVVINNLILQNEEYIINFEDFEKQIADNEVKMFIFCSPHNPVGRVWREDELREIVRICTKYDVLIIADEIHCDFVYSGYRHINLAALVPAEQERIILCTAPSKTFNLAGLQLANIFIANEQLRRYYRRELAHSGYSQPNVMGLLACQGAYEEGVEWLEQLNEYLATNIVFIKEYLRKHLPQVKLIEPQGTYLGWLDFRAIAMNHQQIDKILTEKAGVWLSSGKVFGANGEGFFRINFACSKKILEQALAQIALAFPAQ